MRMALLAFGALTLAGCGSFLPVAEESGATVPYFTASTASLAPPIARIIGPVEGHSCKNLLTDPPATEEAALRQMQARALTIGADGIVDVSFSRAGTSLGTNCWQSVSASGTAVMFERAE
jgi:uncharacterized protein YbjQ (UPF0145 family)